MPANWTASASLSIDPFQRSIRHMHGSFGNAIHVDKLSLPVVVLLVPCLKRAYLQGLPAKNYMSQSMRVFAFSLSCNQLSEGAGCLVENRHLPLAYQLIQIVW